MGFLWGKLPDDVVELRRLATGWKLRTEQTKAENEELSRQLRDLRTSIESLRREKESAESENRQLTEQVKVLNKRVEFDALAMEEQRGYLETLIAMQEHSRENPRNAPD